MPAPRDLDPGAGPAAFFGAELRRARQAAGLSQEQFGELVGFSAALVGKVETGERAPTLDFAGRCDTALPAAGGLFARLWELVHRWSEPYPSWFRPFVDYEATATALRWYEPLLVPGLLQTKEYARAILAARPDADEDEIEQLVGGRLDRQAILNRDTPPHLWCVLDEGVLHRRIGGPTTMRRQLLHLVEVAQRPPVSVQVVPSEIGAHAGLLGGFVIADFDGARSIVYLETATEGLTVETQSIVAQPALTFDVIRSEALPRGASRDLIREVAEERWNS